ncbi:MAG: glycoside hydrolase family 13 protein, partial [Muribaculaceae bacterium]|nr:glycoside hydrolase family 13 protein [Muribaculaceae bacterium]
MKKILSISLGLLTGLSSALGAKGPEVTNIEPPYWWTGMKNDTLQIMLTGPGIARANASIDYKGVRMAEQISLDSPNYKLLYLVIGKDALPGTMEIILSEGKKKSKIPYELKRRDKGMPDHGGFDARDVLYLLMPDRFAKGAENDGNGLEFNPATDRTNPNARHGGDLKGIEQHLDYLDSLGVTALWFCPVLENDMPRGSYHGYATTDYYKIDPRFGSNAEYSELIEKAHDKGLKVVMDMIFNHCGSEHPWMKDKPAADWINHPDGDVMTNFRLTTVHDPYVSDYDLDHTVNGWFVASMPDLNQRNPHLMKYLIQNSIWWIESSKIDGIRMDTYPYADSKGMAEWNKAVLDEYPNFNIVGECWYDNEAGSAFWQKGNKINPVDPELPTVMDFFFIQNGRKAFNSDTDPWGGLNMVYNHLSHDFLYSDPQKVLTFLDNHDSDRFLAELPEDLGRWKQAQAFLLTSRGIPQIYYGTELLMNGSKEVSDGLIRLDMPGGFPGDTTNAFIAEGRTPLQNEAWDFLSALLHWRRGEANEVIAKGRLKHFMPQNGLYVYTRTLGDRKVAVLLNGKDEPLTVTMERTIEELPLGTTLRNPLSGEDVTIKEEMTFAPREVMI